MSVIAEWNEQLQICREKLQLKEKWERRLSNLNIDLEDENRRRAELLDLLRKEEADAEKLKTASFSQFFLNLFGRLEDKLRMEEREAAEAKLRYDAAESALAAIHREKTVVIAQLSEVNDVESQYARLLTDKESWINEHDRQTSDRLEELSLQIGTTRAIAKELLEAVYAAEEVKAALTKAEETLTSAQNWGTYDMIGGGFIATAVKHGRIDEAAAHVQDAQHGLRKLDKELRDINWDSNAAGVNMSGMLVFADFFFDGLISDWIVQGKISSSLESVQRRLEEISGLKARLTQEKVRLDNSIAELTTQRKLLLERFEPGKEG
ncbi:hypothetical protein [Cohnella kolymensis]|uniref:hypothetical protein n=1 Tax=Cohnella kolymensis TaxID=1590652 RepID=UPI0006982AD0|nr:hypothetical protein [Cohnella kolymensis]